jgi:iron-sulfur cluster assembly accessory protein
MESSAATRPADAAAPAAAALTFTPAAVAKVQTFLDNLDEAQGKHLRIFVQGGGCSGFEYGFTFDERKPNDLVVAQDGIEVLLDLFSKPYLEGCEVDYKESLMGSGFSVKNPNAAGTCGCGHSFSA